MLRLAGGEHMPALGIAIDIERLAQRMGLMHLIRSSVASFVAER